MEQSKGLVLTVTSAFYILKHFESIDEESRGIFLNHGFSEIKMDESMRIIGSKFCPDFCSSPFELINVIGNKKYGKVFNQSNGNIVYSYAFDELLKVGTDNILELDELQPNELATLKKFERNDMQIQSIERKSFVFSNELNIVVSIDGKAIINAFPGRYAPPFSSSLSDEKSKLESTLFWDRHAFIQIKKK